MTDTLPKIRQLLEGSGLAFEVWACDEKLSDTATFCAHYGASIEHSANAILIKSKTGEEKFALCIIPATARLNVNHTARRKMGVRKVSFATAEETKSLTGMEIGGVTPLAPPPGFPIWIDPSLMKLEYVILGGGNRTSKIKVSPRILTTLPMAELVDDLTNQ